MDQEEELLLSHQGQKLDADKSLVELALQLMVSAFLVAEPPFFCRSGSRIRYLNATYDSRCSQNVSGTDQNCLSAQNSIHYKTDDFGNTIVSEWNLVCDRRFLASMSSSCVFLGFLIGSFLAPIAADRWGRRKPLLLSIIGLAATGTLVAASSAFWIFCALRTIVGIFVAGTSVTSYVISCEVMAPSKRHWYNMAAGISWVAGYSLVGGIAWLLPDWRGMILGVGLPCWLGIVYYWFIPESLHWLVAKDQDEEAKQWIVTAAKCNKITVDWDQCYSEQQHDYQRKSFWQIFKSPLLVMHTAVLAYIWFANSFIYYGMSLFATALAGNEYVNFVLSGLVELPSHVVITLLLNRYCRFLAQFLNHFKKFRIGRKKTMCLFHFLAGVSLVALIFAHSESGFALFLWLFGKFCVALTFSGAWCFSGEVFPTVVRGSTIGFCCAAARVGGILAPFASNLEHLGAAVQPSIFSSMSILASILVLVLPETRNRKLPDEIEELDPGPIWKFFTT